MPAICARPLVALLALLAAITALSGCGRRDAISRAAVGEEDVRGVKTTHYEATVNLRTFPETLPARERAAARSIVEYLIGRGGSTMAVEFWIDGNDLVRRYSKKLKFQAILGVRARCTSESSSTTSERRSTSASRLPTRSKTSDIN